MSQTETKRRFSKLAAAINQKATKLGARGRITADDLAIIYLNDEGKCRYCQIGVSTKGVSFDHIVAFAKGGSNEPSNIASACLGCQRGKFTKSETEWATAKDMLVVCENCKKPFRPRWADYQRGYGRMCSRVCSGTKGGQQESSTPSA